MIDLVWLVDRPTLGRVVAHESFRELRKRNFFIYINEIAGIVLPVNSL